MMAIDSNLKLQSLPLLYGKGFVYTRMQALMLAAGALQRPQAVTPDTGALLAESVSQLAPSCSMMVIDCQQVSFVDHHALEPLSRALINTKLSLVFLDTAAIATDITTALKEAPNKSDTECENIRIVSVGANAAPTSARLSQLRTEVRDLEHAFVSEAVRSSVVTGSPRRLASTPLKTNIAYNARHIMANPQQFIWTAILFSDALRTVLANLKSARRPGVMAVSLRASPFAVAASLLNAASCEIIDHMGPTPHILEEHSVAGTGGKGECIYVGDFCIGGTELRIAQTYAHLRGRIMRQALVIGSLLQPSDEAFPGIDIISLVDLRKLCPDAIYEL